MEIKHILEFLDKFGVHLNVDESSSPFVLLILVNIFFSIIALLCLFNILIYVGVLYLLSDTQRMEKLHLKLPKIIIHILNFYKKTRFYYLAFEVVCLLYSLLIILIMSLKVINIMM